MQINLPYKAKQALLNVLRDYIPVELRKFTGSIEIPLKCEEIGVIVYKGHVRVKYVN